MMAGVMVIDVIWGKCEPRAKCEALALWTEQAAVIEFEQRRAL